MVDYSFYTNVYHGKDIDFDTFNTLASRSYDIINYLTRNAEETENIKKAECCEIEFLFENGGISALNGNDKSQYTSERIGGYSYSKNSTQNIKYINGLPISPMLKIYLGNAKGNAFIHVG